MRHVSVAKGGLVRDSPGLRRAVVTGATGHLGPSLIAALLERGYRVRAVVFDRGETLDALDVERVPGDVRDMKSLERAFRDQEVVFHLAGMISLDSRKAALMRAINADGAENAARAALAVGARRFVHLSSVHAFELRCPNGEAVDETSPRPDPKTAPAYDLSKAEGELRVRAQLEHGLDLVVLNPTGFIGPRDAAPSLAGSALIELANGTLRVVSEGSFDWLDPRDLATTAITAAEKGRTGEGYLLTGNRAPSSEIARLVDAAMGVRRRRATLPLWIAHAIARLAPLGRRLVRWHPGLTSDALHTLVADAVCDGSKARRELGHRSRPLWESVRDALLWWAERGVVKWTPQLRAFADDVALRRETRRDDDDQGAAASTARSASRTLA